MRTRVYALKSTNAMRRITVDPSRFLDNDFRAAFDTEPSSLAFRFEFDPPVKLELRQMPQRFHRAIQPNQAIDPRCPRRPARQTKGPCLRPLVRRLTVIGSINLKVPPVHPKFPAMIRHVEFLIC